MEKVRRNKTPRGGALATGVGASVLLAALLLVGAPLRAEEKKGESPFAKAEAFEAKKKWKKAEEEYRKVLEAAPDNKESYEALVGFYERQERLDDGVAYFDATLTKHPDRILCHFALFKLHRMRKDPDKAREHFMAILKAKDSEFYEVLMEKEKTPPRPSAGEGEEKR